MSNHRPGKRPVRAVELPESLAARVGPELTEALEQAFDDHPDLVLALQPEATPGISVASYNNWIGSEAKR